MTKAGSEYINWLSEVNEDMLLADGFDEAIVGYIERAGMSPIACYDKDRCIEILAKDMSYDDASEYFYYNVIGAYMGENTPCFLTRRMNETNETRHSEGTRNGIENNNNR